MFKEDQIKAIDNHFGQGYLDQVKDKLETYENQWHLSHFEWIPWCSANLVLKCLSRDHGASVLKLHGGFDNYLGLEAKALSHLNDQVVCKVYHTNMNKGDMVIERVEPGTVLRQEPSYEKRARVFLDLYKAIHLGHDIMPEFPSYMDWLRRAESRMDRQVLKAGVHKYLLEAIDCYQMILDQGHRIFLLHGDFHHDNILKNKQGGYTVIDPKGVYGPRLMDLPRYILNEYLFDGFDQAMYDRVVHIIKIFSADLTYSQKEIGTSLFIETALMAAWCLEGVEMPDPQEVKRLENTVAFSKKIMDDLVDFN